MAPAFGFPVTAPVGMLERMLGPNREPGPAGWALLLLGQAALAALILLVAEHRRRMALTSFAFAVGAWFITGAALMPLIGLAQGVAPAGTAARWPWPRLSRTVTWCLAWRATAEQMLPM